jgi:replicative DNA helicase
MNPQDRVTINKLPTGVPGLDEIVGGGFPEFSFNIIAGAPGSGKTTLAHQFMFANATPERPHHNREVTEEKGRRLFSPALFFSKTTRSLVSTCNDSEFMRLSLSRF